MLEQVRRDIKDRLDELLGEADKLRRALAALGSRESQAEPSISSPRKGQSRRTGSGSRSRSATPKSRSQATATTAATTSPRRPARSSRAKPASGRPKSSAARSAPGATRSAILAALATENAMTAGEIATATGLGRATVSTTLSRLAKTGEVTKAPRGYQITASTSAPTVANVTAGTDGEATAT